MSYVVGACPTHWLKTFIEKLEAEVLGSSLLALSPHVGGQAFYGRKGGIPTNEKQLKDSERPFVLLSNIYSSSASF